MAKKKNVIHLTTCKKCGEQVSGPDLMLVNEAMARHTAKKHSPKVKA